MTVPLELTGRRGYARSGLGEFLLGHAWPVALDQVQVLLAAAGHGGHATGASAEMNQVFPYTSHWPHRRLRAAAHPGRASLTEPDDWEQEEERLASRSLAAGNPTGWFDQLYAAGATGRVQMPWSRAEPHPLLTGWAEDRGLTGGGRREFIVGCGLGATPTTSPGSDSTPQASWWRTVFAAGLPDVTIVVWEGA